MEPLNILSFMITGGGGGFSPASMFSLAGGGFNLLGSVAQGFGTLTQAQGAAAGDEFAAEEAEVNAQYGKLQAVQTGAQETRALNQTLGNIDAIRAAAHDNPTSPTGAAYRETQQTIGTEKKDIDVSNIMAQTQADEAAATYYQQAAQTAQQGGDLGFFGSILGGIGGLLGSIGKSPARPPRLPGCSHDQFRNPLRRSPRRLRSGINTLIVVDFACVTGAGEVVVEIAQHLAAKLLIINNRFSDTIFVQGDPRNAGEALYTPARCAILFSRCPRAVYFLSTERPFGPILISKPGF